MSTAGFEPEYKTVIILFLRYMAEVTLSSVRLSNNIDTS